MPDVLWTDASAGAPAYDSAELRRLHALPMQYNGRTLGARAGVRPGGNALETSIAGSTITVRAGVGLVDPALTTAQGPYWVALPADETHTLTAAHATLARKDITVLRVYDHTEDSSGLRLGRSEYVVGTAGSGSIPTIPAGSFKLSTIDVPASGGGSPVVTLDFPFTVASGGLLPVRSEAERTALVTPYDGCAIYRRDRDWIEVYDGAGWEVQGTAVVSSFADLSAITSPYNGQLVYNTALNVMYKRAGGAWHLVSPISYAEPTQTGFGNLSANTVATIATVNIPDLGVPYKIEASGTIHTTTPALGLSAAVQFTFDSTVWDTNRIGSTGFALGYVVGFDAIGNVLPRQSAQVTGAKTVRMLAQAGANLITISNNAYAMRVRAVPATPS